MNVDEALRRLGQDDGLPREAMQWAIANWTTASPRFVAKLRALTAGREASEEADLQLFYLIHLCGQMREKRAYAPLCRLIADDADLESRLGDAITATLPGVLINVFDGDLQLLTDAIDSHAGDEYARGSALLALAYLGRSTGAPDDETLRASLKRLRRDARPRDMPGFWLAWAQAAAALGYDDLKMDLAVLTREGLLEPRDFGLDDFDEVVGLAQADPTGLAGFHDLLVQPLDDAIGTLESWGDAEDGADEDGSEAGDVGPPGEPFVNPLRNVGRNDPCPCGSGKKFKKCCLSA
jgi:hypothetical protein